MSDAICTGCGDSLSSDREVMVRSDGAVFCATCGFLSKLMPGSLPLWLEYRDRVQGRSHPESWDC